MKRKINVLNHATEIMQGLKGGALLTTKVDNKVNAMTIAWGMLGVEWRKPIFVAFVREGRFTRQQLDKHGEFTVNIPYGAYDPQILTFCGSKSGRTLDKIKELGLTLETPVTISVPGIKELPFTLECKVVYKQKQDLHAIAPENMSFYPQNVDGSLPGATRDVAIAYYGEITSAYFIE